MKLRIKESSWSGWVRDYKPTEVEKDYDIKLNEKYVIKTIKVSYRKDGEFVTEEREVFSFEIIEINSDNIKIKTFQPFSSNPDAINLSSDSREFVVTYDNTLLLRTPTMDAGNKFYLTLID